MGYVYGDSTCGQAALYGLGQTGIPIVNVNNNCSTGSSALFLARQAVETGAADCVLALGFEQMMRGALGSMWTDRPSPFARFDDSTRALQGWDERRADGRAVLRRRGSAYADKYGMDPDVFAKIAVKARKHAANNPYAVFRDPVTVEEVLASPRDLRPADPAAVLPAHLRCCRGDPVQRGVRRANGLDAAVAIRAQAMTTDSRRPSAAT